MHSIQALLPRSSVSRRTPWDRGGRVRGRSPPAVATAWLGHCPSTPCASDRSRGFYTDLQGPAGGSDWHSFEHQSFHPPDRCAPSFLTRSDFSPPDACAPNSLSWGCQIPPLRRFQSRSPLGRVRTSPCSRFRVGVATPDRVPPMWFLTTSTACSSSTVSGCCTRIRPWGSSRFCLLRTGFLATRSCPPELCSPMVAATRDRSLEPRAIVTGARRCRRATVHRSPCPLVVVSSSRLRMLPVATAGPCSTIGAVMKRRVATPIHPLLSWACP